MGFNSGFKGLNLPHCSERLESRTFTPSALF